MHQQKKLSEDFSKAIAQLNEKQLQAVEQLEGPVLVIAGPGTGKTQILAARIGKILLDTDAQANEILCLTYTDAGAVNMRQRLFKFIGPDAYRVNIFTFHAFCNEIIQENLDYFGKLNLEPLSDLESALLFREIIDELPANHILKRFTGDIYYDAPRLKDLFSTMKRENWSVDIVIAAIENYLEDIKTRDEFIYKKANAKAGIKVGDLKQKKYDDAVEKMDKLKAAVMLYPVYLQKMDKKSRYDYDDMILWVIKAFQENPDLLLLYQERYQYILVDEYQDTSGSQNQLLKQLISYWEVPNVFVVGDDDQSIFRFQGANLKNILDFAGDYVSSLKTVVLLNNYRSTQHILDMSRSLIENNFIRLTRELNLNKELKSSHPDIVGLQVRPQILSFENPEQESVWIAHQIESLIKNGTKASAIAVIYRNHSQAEAMVTYLDKKKIGINTKRKIDILTLPFTEKIITILRYLSMELDSSYSGDEKLFEILHYDFFNIQPIDIAKASIAVYKANFNEKADKTSLRRYITELREPKQPGLFDTVDRPEMKRLIEDIEYLLKAASSLTLQQLFQAIITKMGILTYIMKQPDKGWYMQILTNFFNFLKDENRKNPELKVAEFIELIDLMKKNNISIAFNQHIFSAEGVNFMTAHGSKGLEFDYVFLLGCSKKIWDSKGRNFGFSYPDTLFKEGASSSDAEQENTEESRRLFYVALTRAKHSLFVTYPKLNSSGKEQEASQFISEIISTGQYQEHKQAVAEEDMIDFYATQFSEAEKPQVTLIDKNYIDLLLQNYTLSVTHLNNYLTCPLKFYFQNLIRVPSGKSPAATFGQAVHHALNRAFIKMHENKETFLATDDFMNDFSWWMNRNKDSFTREDFKLRMEYGYKILPDYYEQNISKWNKVVVTERKIRNVEIEGVPITGNLDKIEFNGKMVNVVDYKTGKFKNAKPKFNKPSEEEPNGGDYWRQAVFYRILIDNDRTKDWQVVSTEFDFIEPISDGEYHKEKVMIVAEDVETVKNQITSVYSKILNYEFNTGCGKKDCEWCHFVRSNFKQTDGILEQIQAEDADI